jgi:tRNA pseudouridine13 synthase
VKLKCRPEDFVVSERLRLRLKRRGRYSVFRLTKRYWNTLDVVRELEQRHGLRHIGRAGLKDRYSLSTQFISVPGPGPRRIQEPNYTLDLAGMADVPVSRDLLLGNDFTVTVRSLTDGETAAITAAVPAVRQFGFPNYYDEQRFGSARHGAGFIARKLIDGHFNGALRLYLATPSPADDAKTRHRKILVEQHWGRWVEVVKLVPRDARPVVEHLIRKPHDSKGAVALVPRPLLELFVGAYQAWFWNQSLTATLKGMGVPTRSLSYSHGSMAFWKELSDEHNRLLGELVIPAVAPDSNFESERVGRVARDLLASEGLTLDRLRLRVRVRGIYFKGYERRARVVPERLRATAPEPDDLHPGRLKMVVSTFLPTGSYATVLFRRLSLS